MEGDSLVPPPLAAGGRGNAELPSLETSTRAEMEGDSLIPPPLAASGREEDMKGKKKGAGSPLWR